MTAVSVKRQGAPGARPLQRRGKGESYAPLPDRCNHFYSRFPRNTTLVVPNPVFWRAEEGAATRTRFNVRGNRGAVPRPLPSFAARRWRRRHGAVKSGPFRLRPPEEPGPGLPARRPRPWLSGSACCTAGPEATFPSINSSRRNLKNSSQASWRSVAKGPLRSQDGLK
ncbi:unnamed protein product [Caretta caretta]